LFGDGIGCLELAHELAKKCTLTEGELGASQNFDVQLKTNLQQSDFMGVPILLGNASFGSNPNKPTICRLSRSSLCLLNVKRMCLFV
jgi:hypothetical protein